MTIDLCVHHDEGFKQRLSSRIRSGIDRLRVSPAVMAPPRKTSTKTWLARGSPHACWPCTGPPE